MWGFIATLLQLGTTAMGVSAAKEAAEADRVALRAQADMETVNAVLLEDSAKEVERVGGLTVAESRRRAKELKSTQRTAFAANGIDLSSQVAAQVLTSTEVVGVQEAKEITNSALREAWGYRAGAEDALTRARLAREQAEGISPGAEALTSLLSGASRTAAVYHATKGP